MKTSRVFSAILALGTVSAHAADTPEQTRAVDIAQVAGVPAAATSVVRQSGDMASAGTREVSGEEPRRQERPMLDRELGTASDGGYEYYERSEQ
jgi:hypothetical protein